MFSFVYFKAALRLSEYFDTQCSLNQILNQNSLSVHSSQVLIDEFISNIMNKLSLMILC